MKFNCPYCDRRLEIPDDDLDSYIGAEINCPECGEVIPIDLPTTEPEPKHEAQVKITPRKSIGDSSFYSTKSTKRSNKSEEIRVVSNRSTSNVKSIVIGVLILLSSTLLVGVAIMNHNCEMIGQAIFFLMLATATAFAGVRFFSQSLKARLCIGFITTCVLLLIYGLNIDTPKPKQEQAEKKGSVIGRTKEELFETFGSPSKEESTGWGATVIIFDDEHKTKVWMLDGIAEGVQYWGLSSSGVQKSIDLSNASGRNSNWGEFKEPAYQAAAKPVSGHTNEGIYYKFTPDGDRLMVNRGGLWVNTISIWSKKLLKKNDDTPQLAN